VVEKQVEEEEGEERRNRRWLIGTCSRALFGKSQ